MLEVTSHFVTVFKNRTALYAGNLFVETKFQKHVIVATNLRICMFQHVQEGLSTI